METRSPTQARILELAREGRTRTEIAAALGLSPFVTDYHSRLLRLPREKPAPPVRAPKARPLLAKRFAALLPLMAERKTRAEMCSELGLTMNTVVAYLKVIYRVFGVNRRAAAVAKAREAGLLPPG